MPVRMTLMIYVSVGITLNQNRFCSGISRSDILISEKSLNDVSLSNIVIFLINLQLPGGWRFCLNL